MAKQVFDSPDLLRLIYSFGTPGHRQFTQNLKTILPSQAETFYEYFQQHRESFYDLSDCLNEHSIRELENLLRTFQRCFCCTKHSPWKLVSTKVGGVIPVPSVFENHPSNCPCPCRSLRRSFIINIEERRHVDTIELDTIELDTIELEL